MLNELSAKTVDGDVKFREDMQMAPGDNFEVIERVKEFYKAGDNLSILNSNIINSYSKVKL